jgi:hypothetical protein
LVCDDVPENAIQRYVETGDSTIGSEIVLSRPAGDTPVYLARAALMNSGGNPSSKIEMGENALLEFDYAIDRPLRDISVGLLVSRNGVPLLNSFETDAVEEWRQAREAGSYRARLELPFRHFKEGAYTIEFPIHYGRQDLTEASAVLSFEIVNYRRDLTHRSYRADRPGQFAIDIDWHTRKLS